MEQTKSDILYEKVVSDIRNKINDGIFEPGARLATEKALCKTYDVSRVTIRKALEVLISEGMIRRVPNKGVYINIPKLHFAHEKSQTFHDYLVAHDLEPTSKILSMYVIPADENFSNIFKCSVGDDLLCIKRIRYAKNVPFAEQMMYLKGSLFPKFNPWELATRDFREIIETDYNLHLHHTKQSVNATFPPAETAKNLEIDSDHALLFVKAVASLTTGEIYEYNETYINTTVVNYSFSWYR